MIQFEMLHPAAADLLGFIPDFLSDRDPRPAREQFHEAYTHGGGWDPFEGFVLDPKTKAIKYSGDPALRPIARAKLRDEEILVYPNAWVLILQPSGAYEVSRMD